VKPIEIKGYESYLVSEDGVVVNSSRLILKTDLNSAGYKRVTLMSEGKRLRIFVHKLVALTYLPRVEGKENVNHKDGNKLNNHYSNLEWVTPSENRLHAFQNKLCKRPNSYLNDEIVHSICSCIEKGRPAKETRKVFGLKKHVYDDIRSRRYYRDISAKYNW
jgi:hypothetical protein